MQQIFEFEIKPAAANKIPSGCETHSSSRDNYFYKFILWVNYARFDSCSSMKLSVSPATLLSWPENTDNYRRSKVYEELF